MKFVFVFQRNFTLRFLGPIMQSLLKLDPEYAKFQANYAADVNT